LKRFFGALLLAYGVHAQADYCGLYQVEDFGDRTIYTLIEFHAYPTITINFNITNPQTDLVRGMVAGRCYCVTGQTSADNDHRGDINYWLLGITAIKSGPTSDCMVP
jgi:hypothetical protein